MKKGHDSTDKQNDDKLICKKKNKETKIENENSQKKKNQKRSLLLKKKNKEETKGDDTIENDAENEEEESESEENEEITSDKKENQGVFDFDESEDKKMTENIILKAEGDDDDEKPFEGKGKDFFDLYGKEFDHNKLMQGQRKTYDFLRNMIKK